MQCWIAVGVCGNVSLLSLYIYGKLEAMNACGKVQVRILSFSNSALDGRDRSASTLCRFIPGEKLWVTQQSLGHTAVSG